MDQVTARRLAAALTKLARHKMIYVATTLAALRGEWEDENPVWVVINAGWPGDPITEIPQGVRLP